MAQQIIRGVGEKRIWHIQTSERGRSFCGLSVQVDSIRELANWHKGMLIENRPLCQRCRRGISR